MVRCWLVERSYDDRDLVTVVYATPDGERAHTRELSATVLTREPVTAADEIPEAKLDPVTDEQRRVRYRREAERMSERHEPDEAV